MVYAPLREQCRTATWGKSLITWVKSPKERAAVSLWMVSGLGRKWQIDNMLIQTPVALFVENTLSSATGEHQCEAYIASRFPPRCTSCFGATSGDRC